MMLRSSFHFIIGNILPIHNVKIAFNLKKIEKLRKMTLMVKIVELSMCSLKNS